MIQALQKARGEDGGRFAPVSLFNDIVGSIAERGMAFIDTARFRRELEPVARLVSLCEMLLGTKGEASGIALASEALRLYQHLPLHDRHAFFRRVAENFGPDRARVERAIEAYSSRPDASTLAELTNAAKPRSRELIERLNQMPDAALALVRMRAELIAIRRESDGLSELDNCFADLFSSWFNRGFLELRHIDWNAPADILEKIIQYEAVHEIEGWEDLRRRVTPADRRVYGFFHPRLGNEPLIFVEVALVGSVADAIGPLLAKDRREESPTSATTAVFYSISNCQAGLVGIPLGSFLIKQVVSDLKIAFPRLQSFVTLSPVPSFQRWLRKRIERKIIVLPEQIAGWAELEKAVSDETAPGRAEAESFLKQSLAHYLLFEKDAKKRPLDPVARFHLGNGARLERVNFAADKSAKARGNALGMMVNYNYAFAEIEANHEQFVSGGGIAASAAVSRLARSLKLDKHDD